MPSTAKASSCSDNLVDKCLHGTRGNARGPVRDTSFYSYAADTPDESAAASPTSHDTAVGANRSGARTSPTSGRRVSVNGETPSLR